MLDQMSQIETTSRAHFDWHLERRIKMKLFNIMLMFFLIAIMPVAALANVIEISIEDRGFNPTTVSIHKGDTVRWTNNGTSLHSVTSGTVSAGVDLPNGTFDSGLLNPGVPFEYTFKTAGEISYFDKTNTSKTGTIEVNGQPIIISPASSLLHPFQRFDLVLFVAADPNSNISVALDGKVVLEGSWFEILAVTDKTFNIPLQMGGSPSFSLSGGATAIFIEPPILSLSPGVHVLTATVITPSGQEFSDTAVYTMVSAIGGLLPVSHEVNK
jgi:plastocyanin